MKKYISGFICGCIVMLAITGFAAGLVVDKVNSNDVGIVLNNELTSLGTPCITVKFKGNPNSYTYGPVRQLAEKMGGTVEWDSKYNWVRISQTKPMTVEAVAKNAESCVLINVYKDGALAGTGSGFVWSKYIITNKHVLDAGNEYGIVYDNSNLEYRTDKRITVETSLDIDILESPNEYVKSVTLGDSDKVTRGEKIVSISSPLGLKNTILEGVVSEIRYSSVERYIQISALTEHGSSGSPVFNLYGEVISVSSSLADDKKGFCYTIPINDIKPILEKLENN